MAASTTGPSTRAWRPLQQFQLTLRLHGAAAEAGDRMDQDVLERLRQMYMNGA